MDEKTIVVDVKFKNGKPYEREVIIQAVHIISIETEGNDNVGYNYLITDIRGNEYAGAISGNERRYIIGTFRIALRDE